MTLEQQLQREEDSVLLNIFGELNTGIVPATGYAHTYCRQINRKINAGEMCINPSSYRKVYLPTLARAVMKEMACRHANYLLNMKGI